MRPWLLIIVAAFGLGCSSEEQPETRPPTKQETFDARAGLVREAQQIDALLTTHRPKYEHHGRPWTRKDLEHRREELRAEIDRLDATYDELDKEKKS
jgi:hypothetical protein